MSPERLDLWAQSGQWELPSQVSHSCAMIAGAMTAKMMIDEFPWNSRYAVDQTENILTPALVIYPELVDHNIRQTLQLLEGNPDRWRIHVKTAKLQSTMERLVSHGVVNFKAATTL